MKETTTKKHSSATYRRLLDSKFNDLTETINQIDDVADDISNYIEELGKYVHN